MRYLLELSALAQTSRGDDQELQLSGMCTTGCAIQLVTMRRFGDVTEHLGYESGSPEGQGTGNSRNGKTRKTVSTISGPIEIEVPRDRNGSFEPVIVPKRSRRLGNIDDMILSLYSRGMTTRDIEAHLREVYGVNASRELISNVTDVVVDEIKAWQSRPLDEVYPILYVDGIRLRIKDNGVVTTKVAYLAIGIDVDGRKHALGCWIQDAEGAKFWAKILTDLRNRGVKDILIACCDGLTGLPDAIRSVFPDTVVQTCVVHVIRRRHAFRVVQRSQTPGESDAGNVHRVNSRRSRTRS
jgi:putative transposase